MRSWWLLIALCGACGGSSAGDDDAAVVGGGTLAERQRQLAIDLRGSPNFMIGIGNDNDGPYAMNVPIDLHYAYLVGYGDRSGWPTWNAGGNYPLYFEQNATAHGATAIFTYYQLALELETSNDAVLADTARMHQYLLDIRMLFQRIADHGQPVAVSFEPDLFGYLMQRAAAGTPVDQIVASVHHADAPECSSLPETVAGLTRCMVAIGRNVAPLARVGFHASMWGAWYDVLDANADIEGKAREVADFLNSVGAASTDFVGVETLDRDAGFWETSGGGGTCSVTSGSRGPVYWDETTATLPNFSQHLRWVKALTAQLERPALEWQTPLGEPSSTCGGTNEHWRDNRVHYFFGHIPELIDAGVAGMAFGTGAGGQTSLATDNGQLKAAATAYRAAPVAM